MRIRDFKTFAGDVGEEGFFSKVISRWHDEEENSQVEDKEDEEKKSTLDHKEDEEKKSTLDHKEDEEKKSTLNHKENEKEKSLVNYKESEEETSLRGRIIREVMKTVTNDLHIGEKIKNGDIRKRLVEPPWNCPDKCFLEKIQMTNFEMERLIFKEERRVDRIVLQLHGGGYIGKMRNTYRNFAILYSRSFQNCDVLSIDYRVAPENPFPCALEDAFEAYKWILGQGYLPEQIVLAGDSAGGGLALCLCHFLKDRKYELPGGVCVMSPWTDMVQSGESYITNYTEDPLFGNTTDSMIYNTEYRQDNDPKNPYISPLYGDFEGFPPMLIQVGSCEMLLSDSVLVAQKAKKSGVKVRLSIYEGMFHVFQMALLAMPESKRAWQEVGKFFEVLDEMAIASHHQEQ